MSYDLVTKNIEQAIAALTPEQRTAVMEIVAVKQSDLIVEMLRSKFSSDRHIENVIQAIKQGQDLARTLDENGRHVKGGYTANITSPDGTMHTTITFQTKTFGIF